MGHGPMVRLATVPGAFEAKVLAARLGAEGVVWHLSGNVDGPYAGLGPVVVYVDEDDVALAREILLADEVDAVFAAVPGPLGGEGPSAGGHGAAGATHHHAMRWVGLVLVALLVVTLAARVVAVHTLTSEPRPGAASR